MRVRCEGTVRVALPPAEAMELFTAAGERRWAEGWNPVFPGGDEREERGAVWRTHRTTWVIAARDELSATYARVAHGVSAGLVTVRCEDDGAGATLARVTYDLTALEPQHDAELERLRDGYTEYLADWERAIAAAL